MGKYMIAIPTVTLIAAFFYQSPLVLFFPIMVGILIGLLASIKRTKEEEILPENPK